MALAHLDCARCPLLRRSVFACLTPVERARLESCVTAHVYSRGDTIFYEGNPAFAVFCIRSGRVKITRRTHHDDGSIVALLVPGDLVGYRAILAELPYGISAIALETATVCAIARENFLALLEDSHALARHLLQRMAHEFRAAESQLVERNGERVAKRTARLLARLARNPDNGGSEACPIDIRRADLAHILGTTPETLSRVLHELADRGLLKVSRNQISVRDLDGLAELAS